MPRLKPEDIELQAEALNDYTRKTGSSASWFRTKSFNRRDKAAILEESTKISMRRAT